MSTYYASDALDWSLKNLENDEMSEEMYHYLMRQSKLAKQIFNNYKIEGTMNDGTGFIFTHTEPDYKESLIYTRDSQSSE